MIVFFFFFFACVAAMRAIVQQRKMEETGRHLQAGPPQEQARPYTVRDQTWMIPLRKQAALLISWFKGKRLGDGSLMIIPSNLTRVKGRGYDRVRLDD